MRKPRNHPVRYVTQKAEDALRPETWEAYIGQQRLKERLQIHVASAKQRHARLEHMLLIASPGAGKTTIARLIAQEMHANFAKYTMPISKQIVTALMGFDGIVLLDEIHRLSNREQETWLTVIEDGYLQVDGHKIVCPNLTVIGATTEPDRIIGPLYDRFTIKPVWEEYELAELAMIAQHMGMKVNVNLMLPEMDGIAKASGGLPRNVKSLVLLYRDMLLAKGIDPSMEELLDVARISPDGLTYNHMLYLETLESVGGTAGLSVLSSHLRLPEEELLNLERLLVKQHRIRYTPKGRELI